ncbi:MAG: MBL fold metallo-hydrolase [Clostridiales bacterium]|nr:MBL fold metallo-hydrolase [Clostridiales bacterium]
MNVTATIYRGTREIGGTLIEIKNGSSRLLLDAGYPLFLNGSPIDDKIAKLSPEELLKLGVLPAISGLYKWDFPNFDGIIISHAHLDHYGLLKYIHSDIPVYVSAGTKTLIEVSQTFQIYESYPINSRLFKMYESFDVGGFTIKPYLMDHSAFDAAAFEIRAGDTTIIYSGDFRGHGRKAMCLDSFINQLPKQVDVLFTEGAMIARSDERTITEDELESAVVNELRGKSGIALFQSSSQNIDRIVSFYRAALRLGKTFVVDVYTANILHELHKLGNKIPYPSYDKMKVFYPRWLMQKMFREIDEEYRKRFWRYGLKKEQIDAQQNEIVMLVRPSMLVDLKQCNLSNGTFIYSMWQGYRDSNYQQSFENWLNEQGFHNTFLHTSGHAKISDIQRLIADVNPKKIIPIHTMQPEVFFDYSDKVELQHDGMEFDI